MKLQMSLVIEDMVRQKSNSLLNRIFPRNLENRKNNFPYLGADTYFNLCNIHLTKVSHLSKLNLWPNSSSGKVYVVGSLVPELFILAKSIKTNLKKKFDFILISESDHPYKVDELEELLSISEKIYYHNVLGDNKFINTIPLGLEKQSFRNGSRMRDFHRIPDTEVISRPINFLVAWNDETNTLRRSYKTYFEGVRTALVVKKKLNSHTLHKLMRKTLFVPSPAGNGLDCHRTWEALYLGCVPVVLAKDFCGDPSWPVLVVQNWNELTTKPQDELIEIYNSKRLTREQSIDFSLNVLSKLH
jgi:hypothetical protein